MKLEIGKPKKKTKKQPKNIYKFVIELMGGDGDATFYQKVFVEKDNPYLDRFLKFLENCEKEYSHGKGGFDDYCMVEDYYLFVGGDEYPEEIWVNGEDVDFDDEIKEILEKEQKECGFGFEWESNYEHFGVSSFRDVEVSYFDENSIEYKVNVVR